MDPLLILLVLIDIGLFALVVYMKFRMDREEAALLEMHNRLNLLTLESKIAPQAGADKEEFKGGLATLARRLFQLIKAKYNLDGVTTYSEMVDRLTKMDIPLKAELIDFFSTMVILEYSNNPIPKSKERQLREEVIELIKRMGESPA